MQSLTAKLGICVPKQIQRAVPLCIGCMLFVILISVCGQFGDMNTDPTYDTLFPRKIWQTWKVDPLTFEERDLTCAKTWISKNPGYRYEVLTDENDHYYVETQYGPKGINRPDIVFVYKSLTTKIIKADLLRYLVLYAEGGIYTDIDVEALRSADRFVPERWDERDIDLVVGVEIDQPEFKDHPILGQKSQSFCQWTFMAKPRLPVMLRLIDNILKWLNDVAAQQGKSIGEIELDFDEVIIGTGPSAFTNAIMAEMSISEGHPVTWDTFHAMPESKLVGGVLVLTVEAFAAGQGHSDSGNHNARTALVKHHYHASGWPNNHPRYSHPVYGEVEKCNWDQDCVNLWDLNKAAFDAMPPEEQEKQIAYKEAKDAAEQQQREQEEAEARARDEENARLEEQLRQFAAAQQQQLQQQQQVFQPPAAPAQPAPPAPPAL